MSAAGAIEAGQSFVKFYGDFTSLIGGIKNMTSLAIAGGKEFGQSFAKPVSSGLQSASAAAVDFGSQAATAAGNAASGFQNVTASATGAAGAITKAGGTFSLFGRSQNLLGGIVGNLGSIAKFAGAASWGLWGVSKVMTMMGRDSSALKPWITNLSRIGWAAWGVNTALKAASMTARTFSAIASLPGKAIGGIGSLVGRFGRMGGAASMVGTVAESTGESGGAGKSIAAGAMSGAMMGGVVGAGVGAAAVGLGMVIKTALSRGSQEGARESKDFLTQLGVAMFDTGNWIKGIWDQVHGKVKSVFASMKTEGPSVFDRIRQAVFPIVDAVTNVWLPNMFSAIDSIAGAFSSRTQGMGRTWGDFIGETVAGVADFIANFDLYFQYAQQYWVNWTGNRILQFQDMITNFGTMLEWFGKNWQSVLQDIGTLYVSYLTNMVTNFQNAFTAVLDFANGKGFKFEAVNPFEGWESSIKEWPKLIATALSESSPEMDAILGRITDRQRAMEGRRGQGGNIEAAATAVQDEARRARDTRFGAVSAQSQDAYSALSRAMNATPGGKEELATLKRIETQLKEISKSSATTASNSKGSPMPGWSIQP